MPQTLPDLINRIAAGPIIIALIIIAVGFRMLRGTTGPERSRRMKSYYIAASLTAVLLVSVSAAFHHLPAYKKINQTPSKMDYAQRIVQSCDSGCVSRGIDDDICGRYCGCVADALVSKLSRKDFEISFSTTATAEDQASVRSTIEVVIASCKELHFLQ